MEGSPGRCTSEMGPYIILGVPVAGDTPRGPGADPAGSEDSVYLLHVRPVAGVPDNIETSTERTFIKSVDLRPSGDIRTVVTIPVNPDRDGIELSLHRAREDYLQDMNAREPCTDVIGPTVTGHDGRGVGKRAELFYIGCPPRAGIRTGTIVTMVTGDPPLGFL